MHLYRAFVNASVWATQQLRIYCADVRTVRVDGEASKSLRIEFQNATLIL